MNEKLFPIVVPNAAAERVDLAPHESKNVPPVKPSSAQTITARLNPCPSFDSLFPSLSGAVQIGQPKNLIRTGVFELSPGLVSRTSVLGCICPEEPAGLSLEMEFSHTL